MRLRIFVQLFDESFEVKFIIMSVRWVSSGVSVGVRKV